MDILAVETSASSASVAYVSDNKILGQFYINAGLTHSTTLMPMLENMLKTAKLELKKVDCFAVSIGPGSFTGLRIGIASVKGMALAENKPCVAVSSLEAIAWNFVQTDTIVCPLIDARCKRFFTAVFHCKKNGEVERLTEDTVLSYEKIADMLKPYENVILAGDGAESAYNLMNEMTENLIIAPLHQRFQQSVGVAMASKVIFESGRAVTSQEIQPSYISIPQAQSELQKKLK